MLYVKNLPVWERVVRVLVSLAVVAYAIFNLSGMLSWIVVASAVGTALSGLFGFCPACAMLGRRLKE